MQDWQQTPAPGSLLVFCAGETLSVTLQGDPTTTGTAWLRTNIGAATQRAQEIIAHVEQKTPILARDWHDLPMHAHDEQARTYRLQVPLHAPGVFEAKAFFLPQGSNLPTWPEGPNLRIKVEPAVTYAANTMYTAFVRQFGPNRCRQADLPVPAETLQQLEGNDWTIIPKSGTFRALTAQLDHIIATLGFRIIQLLPIHPVPTTFARMGRFGSPFASMDFFNVDPALAEFDRGSTPLDQFHELVDGIHRRQALLFLDLPINHTGWASHLQVHHPEWFARNADHSFASPGAWGVTWEDLSELDYQHTALWQYMADVFLFWCERGVDGFRCDAGYMVPLPVWAYILAKVRVSFPDTIFLLEGLGGSIHTTRALLHEAGLDWAYSEIFQVHDRPGLEHQIGSDHETARQSGTLVHFAETHDNNRIAATCVGFARMRTALAALTADAGAFGITNGVEWFATAKVDVHDAPPLNWGQAVNQVDGIRALTRLLQRHPAFHHGATLKILPAAGQILQLLRTAPTGERVLVLINLDTQQAASAHWAHDLLGPQPDKLLFDLLTEESIEIEVEGATYRHPLAPGQACCLARDPLPEQPGMDAVTMQRLKALSLKIAARVAPDNRHPDPHAWAKHLAESPSTFCSYLTGKPEAAFITCWQWPEDLSRTLLLPASHALLIRSPEPFEVRLRSARHDSMTGMESLPAARVHVAFLFPDVDFPSNQYLQLQIWVHHADWTEHRTATILRLPGTTPPLIPMRYDRETIRNTGQCALLSNGCGAYSQVRLEWGRIESQYDCLLGANLHPHVPVDRHILFTRCRAWLLHKGYSHEIGLDCTRQVTCRPGHSVEWIFDAPAGMGHTVSLSFQLTWQQAKNRIHLAIQRLPASSHENPLPDAAPVTLILRPDLEDRNCHTTTKAYQGPEQHWPASLHPGPDGFRFTPGPHACLSLHLPDATFTHQPEWIYGLPHPMEAERGLDPNGDLFSPGFFSLQLAANVPHTLCACAERDSAEPTQPATQPSPAPHTAAMTFPEALESAMHAFIVKRDESHTVIAGYPWFLDWGRDTLICLRGIIAAGHYQQAGDIIRPFASFEQQGTIPNMIRGNDDRDRDTSDAPLWLFTAFHDLVSHSGNTAWLAMDCNGRSIMTILRSIARHYTQGTPNGIHMDPGSGLIYSPPHFTWMDTNYPAGTPRAGYPIEIQVLWFAALRFLAQFDPDTPDWNHRAEQVQQSIRQHYARPDGQGLSDCLHAQPGTPAADAVPDNALRPNQLFAVTLKAVQEPSLMQAIVAQTARLVVPGAIRSLANQAVSPALSIEGPSGLLNDPVHPYQGHYRGDEDTQRKPAYHNGTAWTWPFPSYCEALAILDPVHLTPIARELLGSGSRLLMDGCIGHIPEIVDGDAPHQQRGCWAQAWGATEYLRVARLLDAMDAR